MSLAAVRVCTSYTTGTDGAVSCSSEQYVETYLFSTAESAELNLISTGGLDVEAFSLFFVGTLLVFATGLGVGLILSQIRKVRRI